MSDTANVRSAVLLLVAALVATSCSRESPGNVVALPMLLTVDDLGAGWEAADPGDVALLPGSIAPPCPFEVDIPDVTLAAADSMEFGNEERRLGVNHTVAELNGEADTAVEVLQTWATMDCSGSDFDQSAIDELPEGMVGFELTTQDGPFTQAVLVTIDGSTMSFVIVSGEGDDPVDIARRLAPRI